MNQPEPGPERPGAESLDAAVTASLPRILSAIEAHDAECRKSGCDARAAVVAGIIRRLGLSSGQIIGALAILNRWDLQEAQRR